MCIIALSCVHRIVVYKSRYHMVWFDIQDTLQLFLNYFLCRRLIVACRRYIYRNSSIVRSLGINNTAVIRVVQDQRTTIHEIVGPMWLAMHPYLQIDIFIKSYLPTVHWSIIFVTGEQKMMLTLTIRLVCLLCHAGTCPWCMEELIQACD